MTGRGDGIDPAELTGLNTDGANGTPPRVLTLDDGGELEDSLERAVERDATIQLGARALRRPISRGEAVKFITAASMALGEKIYNQIAAEHARVFAEMEKRLSDRIAVLETQLGIPHAGDAKDDDGVQGGRPPLRLEERAEGDVAETGHRDRAV